jgi:hypothetical protein
MLSARGRYQTDFTPGPDEIGRRSNLVDSISTAIFLILVHGSRAAKDSHILYKSDRLYMVILELMV